MSTTSRAAAAMLPPEGGSLDSEQTVDFSFQKRSARSSGDGGQDDPHPNSRSSILAFQPECNPPAHTAAASRTACNTVGAAGGHDGADPAELGTHSDYASLSTPEVT
jgi:hypothetical protein